MNGSEGRWYRVRKSVMVARALSADYLMSPEWYADMSGLIAADSAAKAEILLELFQNVFHSDEIMLFLFRHDLSPQIILHRTSNEHRVEQIKDYANGFYLTDPFYLALERSKASDALSFSDLIDKDVFEETEFYRLHYAKTGLVDEFCYTEPAGEGGTLLLSLARSGNVGRYSDDEIRHAKSLAPIASSVLQTGWHFLADPEHLNPPSIEDVKLHENLRTARSRFGRSVLTDREFEVAQDMLRGYTIDIIARRLKMAEGTTKVHRRNIYKKLDIGSHAELLSLFLEVILTVPIDGNEDPLARYEQL